MSIHVVKIHDLGEKETCGVTVLVDRLWPRGVKKNELAHDEWLKEAAPSPALRKWFDHDPGRFAEFRRRYRAELAEGGPDIDRLVQLAGEGALTLLYAARDREHNHAVVLAEWLRP